MTHDDSPRTPPGWEAFAGTLIRLADADARALAWLAPEYGANCVAFMVRDGDAWVSVLHNDGPAALAERPSRFGCAILFPFPGHMMDFRYHWQGKALTIPRRGSTAPSFTHGFAHTHPWQVTAVAPDRATATFSTADALTPDQRAGFPFAIRLTQTVAIAHGRLRISLSATNEGAGVAPIGIGLHPYFAVAALGGERARVRVEIPGRAEHIQAGYVPTGEKRPVTSARVIAPPMGETANVARTDLGADARATLADPPGAPMVEFGFIEGVRDVVLFAPADQPSISVEPQTCAPGAASQPEGHPDGLMPLAAGATRTMTVEIILRLTGG
ncbi:MAG: aldose 1-epimerase [Thermomicrobiales bacterium]